MIGQRYTKTREKIFGVFNHFKKPICAFEIYNFLKDKKEQVDLASIYRNLDLMEKANIINVVQLDDQKKRYELIKKDYHHHHIICNKCGHIEDIKMRENELIVKVKRKTNFKVEKHRLEFFGLCPNCQ